MKIVKSEHILLLLGNKRGCIQIMKKKEYIEKLKKQLDEVSASFVKFAKDYPEYYKNVDGVDRSMLTMTISVEDGELSMLYAMLIGESSQFTLCKLPAFAKKLKLEEKDSWTVREQ